MSKPLDLLFVLRHAGFCRHYESTLHLLARRGHRIHMMLAPIGKDTDLSLAQRLCDEHPQITCSVGPRRQRLFPAATDAFRTLRDYLRFLEPAYARADGLVRRAGKPIAPWIRFGLTRAPFFRRAGFRRFLAASLRAFEAALPCEPRSFEFLRDRAPDLVIVTPGFDRIFSQFDFLKSARSLGLRTALGVASWDNLTNKGLIQIMPDEMFLWNEAQKREAVEMHGIPADRIKITGAQLFDQWFDRRPSTSREEFCGRVGLDPARPFVLYTGSSVFIARNEGPFVDRWVRMIRESPDPRVRSTGLLVRPHPSNLGSWGEIDLSTYGNAVIWPRGDYIPTDDKNKSDYFDSIYHSAAVVGINTSAQVEAGILGRPVLTLLQKEFRETQGGTLHFHHLVQEGLLRAAASPEEHLQHLAEVLYDQPPPADANRRFVTSFIRPLGLEKPCTPILADAIEARGRADLPEPLWTPWWGYLLRVIMVAGGVALYPIPLSTREIRKWIRRRLRAKRIRSFLRRTHLGSLLRIVRVGRLLRTMRVGTLLRAHVVNSNGFPKSVQLIPWVPPPDAPEPSEETDGPLHHGNGNGGIAPWPVAVVDALARAKGPHSRVLRLGRPRPTDTEATHEAR